MNQPVTSEVTYAQAWLWTLDSVLADRSEYNVFQAVHVQGALDLLRLRSAADVVTGRHALLRTCYRMQDGELVGVLLPVDGSILQRRTADSVAAAVELAKVLVRRPFDLGADRPIRIWAIQVGDVDWVVVLCLHHIAVDAWSVDMLWRELSLAYNGDALPPPGPSQADIVARERELRADEFYQEDLADWRAELAGWTPLEIPADRPRPAVRSGRGAQTEFDFGAELTERLAAFADARSSTVFLVATAAVLLTLSRWTGRSDVAVGTVVSGRDDVDLESAVGYFVNTVVIRSPLYDADTVEEFVGRVRDRTLSAFSRAQVPFAELATESSASRDRSRNPLVDVLLSYVEDGMHRFRPGGHPVRPLDLPAQSVKCDLTLTFNRRSGSLSLALAYATDLFDEATVLRFAGHVGAALRAFCDLPTQPLVAVRLLDSAEHDRVVYSCNDTAALVDPRRIDEIFGEWVARTPDAPAVLCGSDRWTYRELGDAAARVADRLLRRGIGRGDRVAVRVGRTPHLIAAILGVLETGAAYVPIAPELPVARTRFLLAHSGADVELTDGLVADWIAGERLVARPRPGFGGEPAYVIYTSGSTGRPHGVVVPHSGVVNLSVDLARRFGWRAGDVVAALAPHSFDMSVPELLSPLLAGVTVRLIRREAAYDPVLLADELRGVSFAQLTPSHWQALLDHGWSDRGLRAACGAEVFPPALAARLVDAVGELWNLYGPTETTVWSTASRVLAPRPGRSVPIGVPLANTVALVLDDALFPVPIGVVGELFLGGAGLALGYQGDAALTALRFVPDPFRSGERLYRTGDLVRRLGDGTLEFQARVDEQVKIRGFRIEPGEVEAALQRHPDVVRAAVGVVGAGTDRRLVAFGVLRAGGDPVAILGFVAALLPGYLVPSALVVVDGLPLSANGKVDRARLPKEVEVARGAPVAPRTDTERAVAAAFRQVLGTESVGVEDDFFVLGGHSLNAVAVVAALRPRFGSRIDTRLLFDHPRVDALAARLAESDGPVAVPELLAGPAERAPLSLLQKQLWLRERNGPARPECNVPRALRLIGPLDVDALERGLHAVAERHDVLRASYVAVDDEPYQVLDAVVPPLVRSTVADLAAARVLAARDNDAPFDLGRGPLWRARLVRITDVDHLLVLVFHHMVVDGPSFSVLWRELAAAYRAEPLARPVLQYADYARVQLAKAVPSADLAYWRRQLLDWPVVELPRSRPRPPDPTTLGADLAFTVAPSVADGLRDLARAHGTTVFTVALAAFAVVAARFCGVDEVTVGTPVSGRDRVEFDELIGFFASMMVLRLDCAGDPTFRDLVSTVHGALALAGVHQRLPFSRVARELASDGQEEPTAPFQLGFVVADGESLHLPGVVARDESIPVSTTSYEVLVQLYEHDGGYDGWIVWKPEHYDRELIAELAEGYRRVLGAVVREPWQRLGVLVPVVLVAR